MQIKIYVDESPIYITDDLSDELLSLSKQKNVLYLKDNIDNKVADIIEFLKTATNKAVIIFTKKVSEVQQYFVSQIDTIEAAGGVVQNEEKDILFIFRRGKWDLPKGKMEINEHAEQCAEREIEEETGIKNLVLKNAIADTFHIYEEDGKPILKISHWYYFITDSKLKGTPQVAEDITQVKWYKTKNIKEPMANTYQNIKDILTIFFDKP